MPGCGMVAPGSAPRTSAASTSPRTQQVDGREFARVEPRIAAAQVDSERIARAPAHHHVRTGDVAVAAHRHGHELGEGVQLGARVRTAAEFMCLPRVIDRPMPKKITPKRARFIRSAKSCNCSTSQAGFGHELAGSRAGP